MDQLRDAQGLQATAQLQAQSLEVQLATVKDQAESTLRIAQAETTEASLMATAAAAALEEVYTIIEEDYASIPDDLKTELHNHNPRFPLP
jgi:isopropylmalate/homocitrate/citramalate synthase